MLKDGLMPMRYYEYLSTAKVDMLYPQIDQTSRSAGGEIGFDLKVIKASRKTDGKKEPTVHEELATVEDWIYANEPVGNIDEPEAWIYGRMSMAALLVNGSWRFPAPGELKDSAAVFAGRSEKGAYLLLAGAARHLTLASRIEPTSYADMAMFASHSTMIEILIRSYPDTQDRETAGYELEHPLLHDSHADQMIGRPVDGMLSKRGPGRTRHYEFLAKRLDTGTTGDGHLATLGTPLFVALAD
jgi:hypothetical protein